MEYEEELLLRIKKKLEDSRLYSTLDELTKHIMVYPESTFDLKPKLQNRISMLSHQLWKDHTALSAPKHDIMGSVLMQGPHMNIDFLIEECARFASYYESLMKSSMASKQIPELKKYYDQLFTIKPKDVLSMLLDELVEYSTEYGFELDKKYVVVKFNEVKESHGKGKK